MENNEWIWYFREERERNGISRKAVAAVAGISREYLCRLETGKLPVTDKTRKGSPRRSRPCTQTRLT